MAGLVSICIPTYQRPLLIREALASCVSQDYPQLEVLVGDDSRDDKTERVVQDIAVGAPCRVRYRRNPASVGQAQNTNLLLDQATGERLILLHDDDRLLPGAVRALSDCWLAAPATVCAYGQQHMINARGDVLPQESATLNKAYFRTSDRAGPQPSPVASALIGQIPNNGYLVLSDAARAVRFRERELVGDACDYDFGIRLAQRFGGFFFLDRYTSQVRLTTDSITRSGTFTHMYPIVKALELPSSDEYARRIALQRMTPRVVRDFALQGCRREAMRIYFSDTYPMRQRPRGILHLLLGVWPWLVHLNALRGRR